VNICKKCLLETDQPHDECSPCIQFDCLDGAEMELIDALSLLRKHRHGPFDYSYEITATLRRAYEAAKRASQLAEDAGRERIKRAA
jgi:hypothetical protein